VDEEVRSGRLLCWFALQGSQRGVALDRSRCRTMPTAVLRFSDEGKRLFSRLGLSACCDFADFTPR
jgi:hypothetical protein